MLRYPATTISLTIAEVKEYERGRRTNDHLAQASEIQHEVLPKHSIRPAICSSPEQIREIGRRHHSDRSKREKPIATSSVANDLSQQCVLAHRQRMPTRDDESGELEAQSLYSSASTPQRAALAADVPDRSLNVAQMLSMRLPPPFSMGNRVVSDEHATPSMRQSVDRSPGEGAGRTTPATPARLPSLTGHDGPAASPAVQASGMRPLEATASFARINCVSTDDGLTLSSSPHSPWDTPSKPPRVCEERPHVDPRQSSSKIKVYSDDVPASLQPSTPQHLPEARHQSRLRGSYTAPVARAQRRAGHEPGTVRRRHARSPRQTGLETPGFRGLYGGTENSDDLALYQEALHLNEGEADHGT
ncbi:hypothetical protein PFICI_09030 [Pestalotiopsis fici W106-1]|uniref:Uncharacterized protein n=1 Tax=Pestalotiopsis fici (strain W106-1 / CGMCC3.15140) TaxID=1229662 RepID=W3X1A7_PESFW|nr:uncharacterized protein PFICI_09030 [Pestalotiopsis fici W106-1]ETS79177.1 hypothetical protein PFICI_09030 [Pestalotiopsis fici W106-1]